MRTLSVLLVVTFRPEFEPGWIRQSHMTPLSLNPLAPRQVSAMIDHIVGNKPLPANIGQSVKKLCWRVEQPLTGSGRGNRESAYRWPISPYPDKRGVGPTAL